MKRPPFRIGFVAAIALIAFTSLALAEDAPKTGQFTETIKDRSPLSNFDAMCTRLGMAPGSFVQYDLANESFSVYVPATYKADGTFGAIVFLPHDDKPVPFPGWAAVLDKHKMIMISPNKPAATGVQDFGRLIGLGLDAATYITARYKIDPTRFYASGVAGARVGSLLAGAYPDVFTGGGLHILGSSFYKDLQNPAINRYAPPSDDLLKVARAQRAHVFVTGSESKDLGVTDKAVFEAIKADGYKHVEMIEMAGKGNEVPNPQFFEQALAKLEDFRKAIKESGVSTAEAPGTNTTNPATPTTPTPAPTPAIEVKKGTFQINFSERAPESSVANLSRAFSTIARNTAEYDISKETFHVYVPQSYQPGKPFGLIVGFSSQIAEDDGQLLDIWRQAIEKRNFIWVSAAKCKPEAGDQRRMGLALDAVHNLRKMYTIDEDRIYALGVYNGAASAAKAGMNFPKTFAGVIQLQFAGFYRDVIDGTVRVQAGFPTPGVAAALKEAKATTRFIFCGGDGGQNHKIMAMIVKAGYQQDGFAFAQHVQIDKLGDNIPQNNSVGKALDEMDKPLAKSVNSLMAEGARLERQRKFEGAWRAFGKAALRATEERRKADAEAKAEAIRKLYEESMAGARQALAAGDTVTGKTTLERIVKEFGAMPTSEAEKLLETVGGAGRTTTTARGPNNNTPAGPDKGPAAPAGGAEAIARNRLDAAKKALAVNLAQGYKDLRDVAERYGDTAAGKEAAAEADKIWADAGKRKTIESMIVDTEAGKLLILAKRFLDAGDFANARDKLNQIVEDYPESKAASEAATLLAAIKDK